MAAIGLAGWSSSTGRTTATLRTIRDRLTRSARRLGDRLRPAALTIAGLGCIDTGAFTWNPILGWAITGISLLVLEYRIDE